MNTFHNWGNSSNLSLRSKFPVFVILKSFGTVHAEKFNDDENLTTLKNIGIRSASDTLVNTDLGTEDLEGIEPTPDQQGAEAAATEVPAAAPTAPGAGI